MGFGGNKRTSHMSSEPAALVSLSPSEVLRFDLQKGLESKSTLTVTNASQQKIIFKVKTTQPKWYFVRPSQQVLDVGQSEDVAILVVEAEGNRFLDSFSAEDVENVEKHRFLVQSRVIDDEEYEKLVSLSPSDRIDEFSKLWGSNQAERKNMKLKVKFNFPDQSTAVQQEPKPRTVGVSENVEIVRNRLARNENAATTSSREEASNGIGSSGVNVSSLTPEAMHTELLNLKKKYDVVVEYTVHLTAERDTLLAQLEELQREYAREANRNRAEAPKGATEKGQTEGDNRPLIQKGFTLATLIIAIILSFIVGRYLKN